jgi:ADP-ribose pyrophosphatase
MVYNGYVDDPRNTDNSWMETTAYHFHCWGDLANTFKLAAGDDAGEG